MALCAMSLAQRLHDNNLRQGVRLSAATQRCRMSQPRTAPLDWSEVVPAAQWAVFQPVLEAVNAGGPAFALGGGLAFSAYSGRKRNTKDMDLFVRPAARQRMMGILTRLDFKDLYEQLPYDRNWIYRGYKDGGIVDIIWQMANYRTAVDD